MQVQEHTYRVQKNKVLGQSWLIGLFALLSIFFCTLTFAKFLTATNYLIIIIPNIAIATVAFLGIYIFLNYVKYSRHKEFVLTAGSFKLTDKTTNEILEIKKSEIKSIELYRNYSGSKFPWTFFEYFCIIDKTGNRIVVTSFIMDISDFWKDTLSRQVTSQKLSTFKNILPTIPTRGAAPNIGIAKSGG